MQLYERRYAHGVLSRRSGAASGAAAVYLAGYTGLFSPDRDLSKGKAWLLLPEQRAGGLCGVCAYEETGRTEGDDVTFLYTYGHPGGKARLCPDRWRKHLLCRQHNLCGRAACLGQAGERWLGFPVHQGLRASFYEDRSGTLWAVCEEYEL